MSAVKLTKEEITKLASLSKIKLSEEELEKFTTDMQTIFSSVEALQNFEKETECNLADVKFGEVEFDTLREDEIGDSIPQKDVLANAPEQENGYFKVHGDVFDGDNS
jgi:aspartyl-tRNA(Asn)/glutamyl-tRNA(Gln) amidotransferase subunit C